MASSVPGKIAITGTGRAGTTLLVRLLTELGLDTGYDRANWRRDFDEHCAAGLERDITGEDSPRIVKNPALCATLPSLLAQGAVSVEHAIIPIRALDDAAQGRIRVGGDGSIPGGLMGTTQASGQKAVPAEHFHGLVHALTRHQIPHTFLDSPFAVDVRYAWEKLNPVFDTIGFNDFAAAFVRVFDPRLIHNFDKAAWEQDNPLVSTPASVNESVGPPFETDDHLRLFVCGRLARRVAFFSRIKNGDCPAFSNGLSVITQEGNECLMGFAETSSLALLHMEASAGATGASNPP